MTRQPSQNSSQYAVQLQLSRTMYQRQIEPSNFNQFAITNDDGTKRQRLFHSQNDNLMEVMPHNELHNLRQNFNSANKDSDILVTDRVDNPLQNVKEQQTIQPTGNEHFYVYCLFSYKKNIHSFLSF